MKLRVSPTALKGWFQYRCERKFVYETMVLEPPEHIQIHEQAIGSAWAEEGNHYEQQIVSELDRQRPGAVLLPRATDHGCLKQDASRQFLARRDPTKKFAHQLLVSSTPCLAQKLDLPNDLEIKNGKIDLIEVTSGEGPPKFRIIDIKATQVATLFHKAQVALYALMLEATLKEHAIAGSIDPEGQIWHRSAPGGPLWQVEAFEIRGYMRLVADFFHQRAGEFTRYQVGGHTGDNTPFHVYFKCEQCKFLGHCRKSIDDNLAPENLDISAVAGINQQAKKTLRNLGITTVGEFLQREGKLWGQDDWVLRTRGANLLRNARALAESKLIRREGYYSLQMPPQVDQPIFLLADLDPVDGRLATLGALVVGPQGREDYYIRVITSEEQEAQAIVEVLGMVMAALSEVDQWNQAHEEKEPLHTHIFMYEPAEATDLKEALGRHLGRDQVRRGLLDLLRMFPPDEVIPEPDYQGHHYLPASSLRTILTSLYAFPLKVSQDLQRVSAALQDVGADVRVSYRPDPDFARPFSSRLPVDLCRRLKDEPALRSRIEDDVQRRLSTMQAMAYWLLRQNQAVAPESRFLRLNKKPFRFRQQFDPLKATDLDVLQAQTLLDSMAALVKALVELARPPEERRDRLNCLADLTLLERKQTHRGDLILTFYVPEASRQAELSAGDFGLILSNGSPDLILSPEQWPGLQVQLLSSGEQSSPERVVAKVWSNTLKAGPLTALLAAKGARFFIDKAFLDVNASKVTAFLAFLAEEA